MFTKQELIKIVKDAVLKSYERVLSQKKRESKGIASSIYHDVYGTPEGKYYERTGELYKSFNNFEYEVSQTQLWWNESFYDTTQIHHRNGTRTRTKTGGWRLIKFGHHRSWPWDNPYPSDSEILEELPMYVSWGFHIFKKRYHRPLTNANIEMWMIDEGLFGEEIDELAEEELVKCLNEEIKKRRK